MPSRIIKESICTSETLAGISAEAERLFWRLVTKADDFGLFYGNPRILASMCFPLGPPRDNTITTWLKELVKADLIRTYTADDAKQYLKIVTWDSHQQRRAAKSKFPLPVTFDNDCFQVKSSDKKGACKQPKSNVPVNENGNENEERGTGNENGRTERQNAAVSFDDFWNVYPRRVGKKDAIKAWGQLNPDRELADQIVAGVERWKKSDQWTKDEGHFIPYPATFLRGERWNEEDRPDLPPKPSAGGAPKNYDGDEDFLKG